MRGADVRPEPGVRPGQHRLGSLLLPPLWLDEPPQHRAPPRLLQHRGVVSRRRDEAAVAAIAAVGHQHVQMRVPVDQSPEALHAHDHSRHHVVLTECRAQVGTQRVVRHPAQAPQPPPVVEEVGAQPLRQRQHHLAVWHAGEQLLLQPQAPHGETARVARGTEGAAVAIQEALVE